MKNTSEDLRNHLFATLEALQDNENPIEIARAKVVSDVAQTLINLAKVESAYADSQGGKAKFFEPKPHLRAIGDE